MEVEERRGGKGGFDCVCGRGIVGGGASGRLGTVVLIEWLLLTCYQYIGK